MFAWGDRRAFTAAVILVFATIGSAPGADQRFGLGRPATPGEIAGWDIDVRPDGQGLPPGQGTVEQGEALYARQCAECHGEFGEGRGRYPALMGGAGSLASENPVKTIGSFWPHATTVFDYLRRAQPFGHAQSLSSDQVYALTAYLLSLNDLIDDDQVLDAGTLAAVRMPNRDGFVADDRPDTPTGEACMQACRDEVRVIGTAAQIDVTPDEARPPGSNGADTATSSGSPNGDPRRGKQLFVRCVACHSIRPGQHRTGPGLHGIIGRPAASASGFEGYSAALKHSGLTWTDDNLRRYLAAPGDFVAGTSMPAPGLTSDADLRDVVSYLRQAAR